MIWLLAGAALALIYGAVFCHQGSSWPRTAIKTGAVVLLALWALAGQGPPILIWALLASALGDALLSRPGERAFLAGAGAFGIGHLCYIWLFLTHPAAHPALIGARWPAAVLLALLAVGMGAMLWRNAGALRGPVVGYVGVVTLMGLAALALPVEMPLRLAVLGAGLFLVSDSLLAIETFVRPRWPAPRVLAVAVWTPYWLAQALIAAAFL